MSQDWTPPPPAGTTQNVPNYLVPAIISAICCFPWESSASCLPHR